MAMNFYWVIDSASSNNRNKKIFLLLLLCKNNDIKSSAIWSVGGEMELCG